MLEVYQNTQREESVFLEQPDGNYAPLGKYVIREMPEVAETIGSMNGYLACDPSVYGDEVGELIGTIENGEYNDA